MGVFSGPEIVSTNGLAFSYDAGNTNKSWIGQPTTNNINALSANILRYNNPGFSGTSVNTGQTYKGMPIYELTFIPQDSSFISRLASGEGFGAYHSMTIPLLANTPYMASIYMKSDHPLQSSTTQGFNNGYSNISGWTNNGTTTTRYQEDGWTRLYTQYLLNQNGYSPRTNTFQRTFTVNTSSTQTVDVNFTILATGDSLSDFAYLHALVTAAPAIASNGGLTGLSIVDHGLNTTTFTKLAWPSSIKTKATDLPFDYFVRLSVPSTGGVNTTITLNGNFTGYYTALTDNKFWKVTFDTTNATVNQVFRTYWCAPMLEQHSTVYPSTFVNGTRSTTQAILDLTGRHTVTANSLTYNANGSFSFDGVDDFVATSAISGLGTATNSITWCVWTRPNGTAGNIVSMAQNNPASGWNMPPIAATGSQFRAKIWNNSYLTSPTYTIGSWYHVCLVFNYDATTANAYQRLFVNGEMVAEQTNITYSSSGVSNFLFFGQANPGADNTGHYTGNIDAVQVYSGRALTPAEIRQNFNATRSRYGI